MITRSNIIPGEFQRDAEDYIDRQTLARQLGVSVATVDRMVRDGMPSETWGRRARRFLPSQARAWARTQRRGRAA